MLRAVFIGYDNRLNHAVAHWLSQETELVGCVWLSSSARWHKSWSGRRDFLRKRIKRRGVFKALDEIAYYVFHHATDTRSPHTRASNELVEGYWNALTTPYNPTSCVNTTNVNDPAVLAYLDEVKPDIIFAHCLNQFFGKKLRNKAKHGIFMWHVGITPEYKGLYSPFWTLYNRDFKNFGYSLIHLTDDIDAGDVYAQGRISNVDVRRDNHVLIEHKIILGSFPGIASFLRELEAGTARPIERPTATPGYYSYPGLTDYIMQRWKVMNAKEPPNVPLGDRALHGSDRIQ